MQFGEQRQTYILKNIFKIILLLIFYLTVPKLAILDLFPLFTPCYWQSFLY